MLALLVWFGLPPAGSGGLSQLLSDLQEPADAAEYRIKIQVGVHSATWPLAGVHVHGHACMLMLASSVCTLIADVNMPGLYMSFYCCAGVAWRLLGSMVVLGSCQALGFGLCWP